MAIFVGQIARYIQFWLGELSFAQRTLCKLGWMKPYEQCLISACVWSGMGGRRFRASGRLFSAAFSSFRPKSMEPVINLEPGRWLLSKENTRSLIFDVDFQGRRKQRTILLDVRYNFGGVKAPGLNQATGSLLTPGFRPDAPQGHRCPFWLLGSKNRLGNSWFPKSVGFSHLPGKPIYFPKKDTRTPEAVEPPRAGLRVSGGAGAPGHQRGQGRAAGGPRAGAPGRENGEGLGVVVGGWVGGWVGLGAGGI